MRAINLLRPLPHYRRDAFDAGLRALGCEVLDRVPLGAPRPGDVLVTWNRYAEWDEHATAFERAGCPVVVAENGYLGADGEGRQLYALALGGHNGTGRWFPERLDGAARWRALGLEPRPWRQAGDHVLVCPSRGIGPTGTAQPPDWLKRTMERLRVVTNRRVLLRPHPGPAGVHGKPARPLEADLEGCHAVVVWGSSAGLKALLAGVPVFHGLPAWIGAPAACGDLMQIGTPPTPDRLPMLERLATAQWTVGEIASGEPFRHLLLAPRQVEVMGVL